MPGSRYSAPGTEGTHTLSLGIFVFLCLSHTCTPDWGETETRIWLNGVTLSIRRGGEKEFTWIFWKSDIAAFCQGRYVFET